MRAVSWHEMLRAALPGPRIRWPPVDAGDDDRGDGLGGLPGPARRAGARGGAEPPSRRARNAPASPSSPARSSRRRSSTSSRLRFSAVVTFSSVPLLARPRDRAGGRRLAAPALVVTVRARRARACSRLGPALAQRAHRVRGRLAVRPPARASRARASSSFMQAPLRRSRGGAAQLVRLDAAVALLLHGPPRARPASTSGAGQPPQRSCWPSTSAPCCPQPLPTSASSRPLAWSCLPRTASARATGSPTGIILQAVEVVTALALGVAGAAQGGHDLAGHPPQPSGDPGRDAPRRVGAGSRPTFVQSGQSIKPQPTRARNRLAQRTQSSSSTAVGSYPQCAMQLSQRGSLPRPYLLQSVVSISSL